MQDIEQLKEQELTELKEEYSLESLITEGANLTIPITFTLPTKKGMVEASALIRPLTSTEWENAQNYALANKKDFFLKVVEKGLLNNDGEPLSEELLRKMPFGAMQEIYKRIADISGIKEDKEEQYKLTKELLGF